MEHYIDFKIAEYVRQIAEEINFKQFQNNNDSFVRKKNYGLMKTDLQIMPFLTKAPFTVGIEQFVKEIL